MLAPKYRIRVDWGGLSNGAFRVGISAIGGSDVIVSDSAGFIGLFLSPYADVTTEVLSGKIQRKLAEDGICDGTLDLTLTDTWPGKYNSKNPASPLYGQIRPGLRATAEVSFDSGATWSEIYTGWLSESESDPDYAQSQSRVNFTDVAYLQRPIDAIPSTGPITVAAALDLVHDAIGWQGARDFRSDTLLADFSVDGTGTGRQAVADLINVDLGFYYVSRGGAATYVDRYEYARRTSVASVTAMGASIPGVALSTVVNRATATGPSSVPQSYEDGHSRGLYGPLPDPSGDVSSPWFASDAAALGNATWRVLTRKDPTSPYWQFQPEPSDAATLEAIVLADVLDVVTVQPVGLPSEDNQIQWVIHDFGGGAAHIVTWRLREKPMISPFIVGRSLVGSTDVVVPG